MLACLRVTKKKIQTKQVGLEGTIGGLTAPLNELKGEVDAVKSKVDDEIVALQTKLVQRTAVRERKAMLQRFLQIASSVDKIETLLRLTDGSDVTAVAAAGGSDSSEGAAAEELSGGKGKLIERVASEFNQLQFHVTQCNSRSPFLDKISPRVAQITETLRAQLEKSFRQGIAEQEDEILQQCLRTYALIEKIEDAELLFREVVVAPYVAAAINRSAVQPESLEKMYDGILEFVDEHCVAVAEAGAGVGAFDFMANAVWPEIATALKQLPFIFSCSIAEDFRKNYGITQKFVDAFELKCATLASVKRLRAHPSFVSFRKRWSLPVYFQLRFQEIAGGFETALAVPLHGAASAAVPPAAAVGDGAEQHAAWRLGQAKSACTLIRYVWSDSVYIGGMAHRFWKFTLQLLARYGTWLQGLKILPSQAGGGVAPLIHAALDCELLLLKLDGVFDECVVPRVSALDVAHGLKAVMAESKDAIAAALAVLRTSVAEGLGALCTGKLTAAVQAVPRQYRHTKRKPPTAASAYVEGIFGPLQTFADSNTPSFGAAVVEEWMHSAVANAAAKFEAAVSGVLAQQQKVDVQLGKVKRMRGGAKADAGGMSDYEKIRLQLHFDVTYFATKASTFGETVAKDLALARLIKVVDDAVSAGSISA